MDNHAVSTAKHLEGAYSLAGLRSRRGSHRRAVFHRASCAVLVSALAMVVGCARTPDHNSEVGVQAAALCSGVQLSWSPADTTMSGTVTLAATNASCAVGETPEYKFYYRREGTGSAYTVLRDWAGGASVAWDTTAVPSGKYTLMVDARAQGSTSNYQSRSTKIAYVGDVCLSVALATTPAGAQAPGTVFAFTASASCTGSTPAQYQFARRLSGTGTYTVFQAWSTSAAAAWDTTGWTAGQYDVMVYARSGSNLVTESQRSTTVRFGELCSFVSSSTSPATFAAPGDPVGMLASATCTGAAQPQYRYLYRLASSTTYTEFQGWTTAGSATWDTTGLPLGNYYLRFELRGDDFAGTALQSRNVAFALSNDYCGSPTLATSVPSPQPVGTPVTLTAGSTCVSGTPAYKFTMVRPDASTVTLQDWSATASFMVTNESTLSGIHTLRVEVRAAGAAAVQGTKQRSFSFGDICSQLTFTSPNGATLELGASVPLAAVATCSAGASADYLISYRPGASGVYVDFHGWSPLGDASWDTSALALGSYQLRAQTRASGNVGTSEATRWLSVTLVCPAGYEPDGSGHCADLDECAANSDNCDPSASCANTVGSFSCTCPAGTLDVNGDGTECTTIADLTGGWRHSCAVTAGGRLYCWGDNTEGQLGDGSTISSTEPVRVGVAVDWDSVAGGYQHTCGIRSGRLYCWGANYDGELGDGTGTNSTAPVAVGANTDWTDVAVGYYHSCGIRGGELYCWGWGEDGELGDGTGLSSLSPVQVGVGNTWEGIAVGGYHSCGISNGSLYCWGWNGHGQLGDGTTTQSLSPVQVGTNTDWDSVANGAIHSCAIRNGSLYCWGYNTRGGLGDGTTTQRNAPVQVGTATDWAQASLGTYNTCGTRTGGTLYCWGGNTYGELGDGTSKSKSTPVQIGTATDWSALGVGGFHSCGARGGDTYCWGDNRLGQLGDGTTTARGSVGTAILF